MFYIILGILLVLLIIWFKISLSYWERRGIPGPKPWPIIGNIGEHLIGKKTLGEVMRDIYKKYDGYPFVGVFRATTPCLLVRDPDFVNKILVKDHKAFYNNDFYIDKNVDPLFGQNIFILRNQEWKDTRQMITPGFTTVKIKQMYQIIENISDTFITFIQNHPTATTDGIETRDLTKRYTLNNVASVAFGVNGRTFEHYDQLSEFMKIANAILTPGSLNGTLLQLNAIFPLLGKLLSVKLVPKDVEQRFVSIVAEVIKHRKENKIQINDYFQFILEIAEEKGLTTTDIAAHGVTLFLDGYESSSNVFSYLLFHLAMHPKYQKKIREEIKSIEEEHEDGITYETLSEMKWMDACIYESLRLTPFLDILVKQCTQPYEYTPTNPEYKKMSVNLIPGDTIILPYSMLMKDEKYFEKPNDYIPERMLDKDNFNKSCFFPFGLGPRACIGQRLGLMQIKFGAAQIIKNFEISLSPRTKLPLKLVPFNFLNDVEGGIWLRYEKIN